MHLIGYFEGIESERGIEWRCADSMSLREFLGVELTERVPDHSTLSRMRMRLPLDVHQQAFALILGIVERKGLLRGRVSGVDSTFLRADASMKAIVRRDTKESYPQFIQRLAEESGMERPTEEDARRFDRSRAGKRSSNKEWESATDSDARIAKLKEGRTRLAYKSEHVVDLETGAVVGVSVHPANRSDPRQRWRRRWRRPKRTSSGYVAWTQRRRGTMTTACREVCQRRAPQRVREPWSRTRGTTKLCCCDG
jgi:hypothetical protein